jgi:hypothetical protein
MKIYQKVNFRPEPDTESPTCRGRNEIEDAMKRQKYNIIWEFVERVERRAEAEIEKTHKIEGAHFRAIFAELRILEKELEHS